jgi:hypothetical protein
MQLRSVRRSRPRQMLTSKATHCGALATSRGRESRGLHMPILAIERLSPALPSAPDAGAGALPVPPPFASMKSTPTVFSARRTAESLAAVRDVSVFGELSPTDCSDADADARARSSALHSSAQAALSCRPNSRPLSRTRFRSNGAGAYHGPT